MNNKEIAALSNDPLVLKNEIIRLTAIVGSYETAKVERAKAEAVAAASPAASFEIDVFNVRAQLEGLGDGSEDITDPLVRGTILRGAIKLLNDMFAALPKA